LLRLGLRETASLPGGVPKVIGSLAMTAIITDPRAAGDLCLEAVHD
jgi:hypothetical protein